MRLSGDLGEEDRQCAWELYTEISTRVAVTGKLSDPNCEDFSGELYTESLTSLYIFFQETRKIMKKFPVGRISTNQNEHLGVVANKVMVDVLRPFLEKWQSKYRHWWENQNNPRKSPFERQSEFPDLDEFLKDWSSVRWLMGNLQKELVKIYQLIDMS